MSSTSWTIFWKKLGIQTEKKHLILKNYKPSQGKAPLRKLGITTEAINRVYESCLTFPDKLMFQNLSRFARKDFDAVMVWSKTTSRSAAFEKLAEILTSNTIPEALVAFKEIHRIYQYNQKGEGSLFTATNTINTIESYNPRDLVRRLNIKSASKYTYEGSTNMDQAKIICISKGLKTEPVLKFMKLTDKGDNTIDIAIAFDSKKEMAKVRNSLQRHFGSYLDSPEISGRPTKLRKFLTTGLSKSFCITGITYYDNDFRQSIYPAFGRFVNVLTSTAYQQKMRNIPNRELQVADIRLSYNDKSISKPVKISFLSYHNNIIGAFLLKADDRNLNSGKAAKLKLDFKKEVGIPLNMFVKTDGLNDVSLYKYFLQTIPKRDIQLELRSPKAMKVYTGLLKTKIIEAADNSGEQSRFCVNKDCAIKFKADWSRKFCPECKEPLIMGKRILVSNISDSNIIDYIIKSGSFPNIKKLSIQLLGKKIFIASVSHNDQTFEIIPLTRELKDSQLEVLAHRFTNSVIITTMDNVMQLEQHDFTVIALHELVYEIEENKTDLLQSKIQDAENTYPEKLQTLAKVASKRIDKSAHYILRNADAKNLGAELFEADCSVVLDRILGNSLWLGAKHRGSSVPDGFSSFPMLLKKHGCLIWDGKFSQGKGVVMGKPGKNKKYIDAAKKNKSIVANGGLKAFVFISNNAFPKKHETTYTKLVKGSRIKLNFLEGKHLKLLSNHFARFEKVIQNNPSAKAIYVKMLQTLLYLQRGKIPIEVIETARVEKLVSDCQAKLTPLAKAMKLTVEKKKQTK